MTEQNPALHLQGSSAHTAQNERALTESIFGSREGVVTAAALAVTANGTPNMSVNVAAGRAIVDGDDNVDQGFYLCFNNGTVNLAIGTSDATLKRIDLVVARVRDTFYAGGTNAWDLFVVAGTLSASPVAPATPASCLPLATVLVTNGVSVITGSGTTLITDLRQRTAALGAILPATSALVPASPTQGQTVYITDTGLPSGAAAPQASGRPNTPGLYIFDGTKWNLAWNMPWGDMGYSSTPTAQTGITAETDLTSLTVTYTAVANRRIRVTGGSALSCSNTASTIQLACKKTATQIGRGLGPMPLASGVTLDVTAVDTSTTGAVTYKLSLAVAAGGGTVQTSPGATDPAWILVEDIGPNGQPT